GSVSSAAMAAIRQYVPENHVDCSCGVVVAPSAPAASWSTTAALTTTAAPSAARPSAVLAVDATLPAPPPSNVETAPPTCPVTSCLPLLSSAPPLETTPQAIPTALLTMPATPQAALGMLSSATGATAAGLAATGAALRSDRLVPTSTASTAILRRVIWRSPRDAGRS